MTDGAADIADTVRAPGVATAYALRPLQAADLGLIATWLAEPHVSRWWGDSAAELAAIRTSLAEPGPRATQGHMVSCHGAPLAYIQVWDAHRWSEYGDQPAGTKGLDQFIGPALMVGRGHGPRFIALMTERVFKGGAPRVIIDPGAANHRAIRAYAKAGFRSLGTRQTRDGPVVLMAREPGPTRVTL